MLTPGGWEIKDRCWAPPHEVICERDWPMIKVKISDWAEGKQCSGVTEQRQPLPMEFTVLCSNCPSNLTYYKTETEREREGTQNENKLSNIVYLINAASVIQIWKCARHGGVCLSSWLSEDCWEDLEFKANLNYIVTQQDSISNKQQQPHSKNQIGKQISSSLLFPCFVLSSN
jgi:hypothetical protein